MENLKKREQKLFNEYIDKIDSFEDKILKILNEDEISKEVGLGTFALIMIMQLEKSIKVDDIESQEFVNELTDKLFIFANDLSRFYIENNLKGSTK